MDQFSSPINDPNDVEANNIRELICSSSWDQIRSNTAVLSNIFNNKYEFSPGDMILAERTFWLGKIFANSQNLINKRIATKLLEMFTNTQDMNIFLAQARQIDPNLQLNPQMDPNLVNQVRLTVNGLYIIEKVAYLEIAENIFPYVSQIKKISPEKINGLLVRANALQERANSKLNKQQELSNEEIDQIVDLIGEVGRSKFEIENLKYNAEIMVILDIFQKTKDALQVVQQAYRDNMVGLLDNIGVIAQILEKIKS